MSLCPCSFLALRTAFVMAERKTVLFEEE
jgi:hypothetical protein